MITPTQSTTQTNVQNQSSAQSQTSAVTSDFETFLLMMTTQAQNQDPLEPMESSEYASQLAQFSMVEQQVQTNDLLSELALALGSVNLDDLASWVGMEVQTTGSFHFGGTPETVYAQPDPAADAAFLVIRDSNDTVIDKIAVPVTETEFTWAGTDNDGSSLPAGTYSATLESYEGDTLLSEQPAAAYNQVVEAQVGDGTVLLTLESGEVVLAGMVSAVRAGA